MQSVIVGLGNEASSNIEALYVGSFEDLRHIRYELRKRALRPYEQLETAPIGTPPELAEAADTLLRDGWKFHNTAVLPLEPPIVWQVNPRSKAFHLHALDPVGDLLLAYSECGTIAYLERAYGITADWIAVHQTRLFDVPLTDALRIAVEEGEHSFAWYDMAIGQRAYRLAYLTDVIARFDDYTDHQFVDLLRTVLFHLAILREDRLFKSHNNHGLYQALGQLAAARRFDFLPALHFDSQQARERCRQMIEKSFFPSGAHKEHSPAYHRMILGSLIGASKAGLLSRDQEGLLAKAQEVLRWMVQPNGILVPIGDTDRVPHKLKNPPVGVRAYLDAGYAFARFDRSYLAQHAGFHSRVHKHADHLSFVWHDRGRDILTDPGRFAYEGKTVAGSPLFNAGFWYSHPSRIYVERTRAHNTIEIDGLDFPRRKVTFTGSSLQYADEQDGLVVTSCETYHFKTIRHWRGLVLLPSKFLLVLDWLHDDQNEKHEFRQNFHFAPEWSAVTHGGRVYAQAFTDQLFVSSLVPGTQTSEVIRGRQGDDMFGWISDKPYSLVPSPSFAVIQKGTCSASFATLFCFDEPAIPDFKAIKIKSAFRTARLVWHYRSSVCTLRMDRKEKRPTVTFRMTPKRMRPRMWLVD